MTDFKKVSLTSKEALLFISMLEDKIQANTKAMQEAPMLANMQEEENENTRFKWIIEKLDKTFWHSNGDLK